MKTHPVRFALACRAARHLSSTVMRVAVSVVASMPRCVSIWLTLCVLTLPSQAWHHHHIDPAGTWQGRAPAADAARRVFTLNLAVDGTAVWDTLYIGKHTVTQHGHWTRNGRQIVLTFDATGVNQPPQPITFLFRDHQLHPVDWDANEWGKAGPPTLSRAKAAVQEAL
jgi:hypothetical protein